MRIGIEDRLYVGINKIKPLYEVEKIKDVRVISYDVCLLIDIVQYGIVYDDISSYTLWIEKESTRFKPGKYNESQEEVVVSHVVDIENFDKFCEDIQEAITKFLVIVTGSTGIRYSISNYRDNVKEYYDYQRKNREQ